MTKDKAREVLERGGCLNFEAWTWSHFTFVCGCNEEDYTCCYETFNTIDDMIEHIDETCGGFWDLVEEL